MTAGGRGTPDDGTVPRNRPAGQVLGGGPPRTDSRALGGGIGPSANPRPGIWVRGPSRSSTSTSHTSDVLISSGAVLLECRLIVVAGQTGLSAPTGRRARHHIGFTTRCGDERFTCPRNEATLCAATVLAHGPVDHLGDRDPLGTPTLRGRGPRNGRQAKGGCALVHGCRQQVTTKTARPDASTRARMSSGSLVMILSPVLATATTVASTASPLPARPRSSPASWPRDRSTALTSTERRSRERTAWRPAGSLHTWATTAPLLRSSSPLPCATRRRAAMARSPRPKATNAPASRMTALTRLASFPRARADQARRSLAQARRRLATHAPFPSYRGTRPAPPPAGGQRRRRPATPTARGRCAEPPRVLRHRDQDRTKHSACLPSYAHHTTVGHTVV